MGRNDVDHKAMLDCLFDAWRNANERREETYVNTCKGRVVFKPTISGIKVKVKPISELAS